MSSHSASRVLVPSRSETVQRGEERLRARLHSGLRWNRSMSRVLHTASRPLSVRHVTKGPRSAGEMDPQVGLFALGHIHGRWRWLPIAISAAAAVDSHLGTLTRRIGAAVGGHGRLEWVSLSRSLPAAAPCEGACSLLVASRIDRRTGNCVHLRWRLAVARYVMLARRPN